jgi:hypothetical protein
VQDHSPEESDTLLTRRIIVVLPLKKKEEAAGAKDECQFICRALFSETFHIELLRLVQQRTRICKE